MSSTKVGSRVSHTQIPFLHLPPPNMHQALYPGVSCTSQPRGISEDGVSGVSGNAHRTTAGHPASSRHVSPLLRHKPGQKG